MSHSMVAPSINASNNTSSKGWQIVRLKSVSQVLIVMVAFLSLWSCSDDKKTENPKPSQETGQISVQTIQDNVITVVDFNDNPIAGAQVLIGESINAPFENNLVKTDDRGQFVIPAQWDKALTVTIDAPGYVRASFFEQPAQSQVFRLHKTQIKMKYELSGVTTGHNVVNHDGFVNVGLLIPALTRKELFNFDINNIMSAQLDDMSVMGQNVKVPSNVTIPRQSESYYLPITLEKPRFHINFPEAGNKRLFAASAKFPFSEVIDGLRGGRRMTDMINYFKFVSGSIIDVHLTSEKTEVKAPVNSFVFQKQKTIRAPILGNDEEFIAVAVSDVDGYMLPSDIKQVASNTNVELAVIPKRDANLVAVLKSKLDGHPKTKTTSKGQFSVSMLHLDDGVTPDFLPLIDAPKVISLDEIELPKVNARPEIVPLVSVLVLTGIQGKTQGQKEIAAPQAAWEVYVPGWATHVKLPNWPLSIPQTKKRWMFRLLVETASFRLLMS